MSPFSLAGVSNKNALGRPHGFLCEAQGTLFFDVARIIAHSRPRAFLLENVKNLRSHDHGSTFRVIRSTLENDLGYSISARVMDARGFVPQHRERIFIAGFREDIGFDLDGIDLPSAKAGPKLRTILHPADHHLRHAAQEAEGARVGSRPVGQPLAARGLGVGVA